MCIVINNKDPKKRNGKEQNMERKKKNNNNNANHKSQLGVDFQYNKYGSSKRLSAVQLAEVSFGRRQLAVVAACHRLCR